MALVTLALVCIFNLSLYAYHHCILSDWNKSHIHGVAMTVCWMIWYCYSVLLGFKCIFQLYRSRLSVSWYGYGYHVTLCNGQFRPITVCRSGFWFCAVRCWVSLCVPFTNSLIGCYFITMAATIIGIFMAILFILNYAFGLAVTR